MNKTNFKLLFSSIWIVILWGIISYAFETCVSFRMYDSNNIPYWESAIMFSLCLLGALLMVIYINIDWFIHKFNKKLILKELITNIPENYSDAHLRMVELLYGNHNKDNSDSSNLRVLNTKPHYIRIALERIFNRKDNK